MTSNSHSFLSKTEIPKYFLYVRHTSRRKLTLRLNSDVVEYAKNAGINFSYFLEIRLLRGNASRDFQSRAVPGWATSAKSKYRE
jgi:hypothetical protein